VSQRPTRLDLLTASSMEDVSCSGNRCSARSNLQEFELIIRDDNSTDGSQRICQKYKQLDPRVRYRENVQRLGLFQNYNECIKAAKGSFIKLYAQDDLMEPDAIQKMQDVPEQPRSSSARNLQ